LEQGSFWVTEPGPERTQSRSPSRQWVKYTITLFLIVAVVVTGALAFHSRDAWWQKYLSFVVRP